MITWEDTTDYRWSEGEPSSEPPNKFTIQAGDLKIVLHHLSDRWSVYCSKVGLGGLTLEAKDLQDAKLEAIRMIKRHIRVFVDNFKQIEITVPDPDQGATMCTQCPHTVGDAYQRDCCFPDCCSGNPDAAAQIFINGLRYMSPEEFEKNAVSGIAELLKKAAL